MNKLDIAQPTISSLLTEAAKYAEEGKFTTITSSIGPEGFSVSIHVSDTPIPTEDHSPSRIESLRPIQLPPVQPLRPIEPVTPPSILKAQLKMEEARKIIDDMNKNIEEMRATGERMRIIENNLTNSSKIIFSDIFNAAHTTEDKE